MSSADLTETLSARVFLLGDATDTVEVLARSLDEQGLSLFTIQGLRKLSGSALQAVHHEIATVANGVLDLDLGEVLMSGWRKYTDLVKAAERTLASPGSEEVVALATHRVSSTHRPSVELLVDGVTVYTFVFELTVVFDLTGVAAVIRQGDLVTLRGGECVITATLTLEKTPLELSRKGRIDLALVLALHRPIPLVRRGRHTPASTAFAPSTPFTSPSS